MPKGNPLLMAIDNGGTLTTVQTKPLIELVSSAIEMGNVHVNLAVMKDIVGGGIANAYNVYHLSKVDGVTTASPYGVFVNGIDKNIKMDADGNFTYMD